MFPLGKRHQKPQGLYLSCGDERCLLDLYESAAKTVGEPVLERCGPRGAARLVVFA